MGGPCPAFHPPRDALPNLLDARLQFAAVPASSRIPRRNRPRDRHRCHVAEGGRDFLLLIRSWYEKNLHHFIAHGGLTCSARRGSDRRAAIREGREGREGRKGSQGADR